VRVNVDCEVNGDVSTHSQLVSDSHVDAQAIADIGIASVALLSLEDEPNGASGTDGTVYLGLMASGFYVGVIHRHRHQAQYTLEERYAYDSSIPLAMLLEGYSLPLCVVIPVCAALKSDTPVRVRESLLTVSCVMSYCVTTTAC